MFAFAGQTFLSAQEPAADTKRPQTAPSKDYVNAAQIAGAKENPDAVHRGANTFSQYCAGCHGAGAKGGPGAPDLVRSLIVLDDEKGLLIGPVLREGRPDKGMPKLGLTEPQITDIVAWLHVRTYAAGHRGTYTFGDVVTGNPKEGQTYFQSKCASCHSAAGDLAGVGKKYDPFSLQAKWLHPRDTRRGPGAPGSPKPVVAAIQVTVTPPSGEPVVGTLERIDDFTVSMRDKEGQYRSFSRDGDVPKVELKDPLQAHSDLLRVYTDADIHNITAYLVTLK